MTVRCATRCVVLALAAVLALSTGCQSDEGPTPATPEPGSAKVEGLAFVPPEGMKEVQNKAQQRNSKASLELVGTTTSKAAAPAIDVFVERGKVGALKVRTTSIVDIMKVSLRDVEIVRNEKLDVPGALKARIIEATFSCAVGEEGDSYVPCRQVEILVQMPEEPQYGIRYGMPESDYTKSQLRAFTSSIRVTKR